MICSKVSLRSLCIVLFFCSWIAVDGVAQYNSRIDLVSNHVKIGREITLNKMNDDGLTYTEGLTIHTLTPSQVKYVSVGDTIYGYDQDQRLTRISKVASRNDLESRNVNRLLSKRSNKVKFWIGTGQAASSMFLIGPAAGIGAIGGLIGAAMINSNQGEVVDYGEGAGVGAIVGYAAGTVLGTSLIGKASYGHAGVLGSALGAVVGVAAGGWLLYEGSVSTPPNRDLLIAPALIAPILGSMVGYYIDLGKKRERVIQTKLNLHGDRVGLEVKF